MPTLLPESCGQRPTGSLICVLAAEVRYHLLSPSLAAPTGQQDAHLKAEGGRSLLRLVAVLYLPRGGPVHSRATCSHPQVCGRT